MATRRIGIVTFLFCLCLFLMPCSTQAVSTSDAIEPLSPERDCTLTLSYTYNGTAFANVPVKLYRVADVSAEALYTLSPSFSTSRLHLNGIQSAGEWDVIRSTLEAHILANTIQADFAAVTDRTGQVQFESLVPGLYLTTAGRTVQDGLRCSFASALIALPGLKTDGLWQYELTVTPKPVVTPPPRPVEPDAPDEEIQFKVLKLWKDESSQMDRPQSIEVEIFRDGVSYQTVTLSEGNIWSYAWTAENDGADWMVVERNLPVGYTVSVEAQGATFILTNTRLPDVPPVEDPPFDPDTPDAPSPSDSPKTGDTPHILLYTVLMYVSGIILILLGITGTKKRV